MRKIWKVALLVAGIVAVLGVVVSVLFFFSPKPDTAVAQVEDFVAANPDISAIYTGEVSHNLQSTSVDGSSPDGSNADGTKSPSILGYNENQSSRTAAASTQYVLQTSLNYDIIYLYDAGNLAEPLRVYDFSDRKVPSNDYFVNQLNFADEDTFAFLSYETAGDSFMSELYVFDVDSAEPVSVTGVKVQVWSSLTVGNELYFNYVEDSSGSFADAGMSVNVLRAEEQEPLLTAPRAGVNSGLFWDGENVHSWWQNDANKLSIVDINSPETPAYVDLAAEVNEPITFIASGGSGDVVGMESGIYSFTDGNLDSVHEFAEGTPVSFSAKVNIDKGFITQSYKVKDRALSSIYSLNDGTLTWVNAWTITVW